MCVCVCSPGIINTILMAICHVKAVFWRENIQKCRTPQMNKCLWTFPVSVALVRRPAWGERRWFVCLRAFHGSPFVIVMRWIRWASIPTPPVINGKSRRIKTTNVPKFTRAPPARQVQTDGALLWCLVEAVSLAWNRCWQTAVCLMGAASVH